MRPSTTPLLKLLAARGLLALAFLFGQQTAALHWLSHAVEATTQAKAGTPAPSHHCDDCLAVAGLGAAAPSSGFTLPAAAGQQVACAATAATASPAAPRPGIQSRAPPILV